MGGYQKNKPILAKETEENKEINRTEGMEQNSYHNEEEESIIAIAKQAKWEFSSHFEFRHIYLICLSICVQCTYISLVAC